MMTTQGPKPLEWLNQALQGQAEKLNRAALALQGDAVKAMPVGVGGELSRSFSVTLATPAQLVATMGTSSDYFLPLELGRKPGKGISREGQESTQLWARRKLGLDPDAAKGFAYLLSEKYKMEGRPAQGLLGLAQPGQAGGQAPLQTPVNGSILHKALEALKK